MNIYLLWTVRLFEVTGSVGGFSEQRDFRQNMCWIITAVSSLKYISILLLFFSSLFHFTSPHILISNGLLGVTSVHLVFSYPKRLFEN